MQDRSLLIRDRMIATLGGIVAGAGYNRTVARATADYVNPSESDNMPLIVVDSHTDEYQDLACDQIKTISY